MPGKECRAGKASKEVTTHSKGRQSWRGRPSGRRGCSGPEQTLEIFGGVLDIVDRYLVQVPTPTVESTVLLHASSARDCLPST